MTTDLARGDHSLPPRFEVPSWRPLVTVNAATSRDGRIAAPGGGQVKLSDELDLVRVHQMRADHDAILVGAGTVRSDDPSLRVDPDRVSGRRDPLRVVLSGRTPPESHRRIFGADAPTVVFVPSAATSHAVDAGVEVVSCDADEAGRVALDCVLTSLRDRGIRSVMVEGGARVLTSFLHLGFVDRMSLFVAGRTLGDGAVGLVEGALPVFGNGPPMAGARLVDDGVLAGWVVAESSVRPEGWLLHLAPDRASR